jgi:hypothetical protein
VSRRLPDASNVVPFPVDEESRSWFSFEQVRQQIKVLDGELGRLAEAHFRSSAEWSLQAAVPIERTQCIRSYLAAVIAADPPRTSAECRQRACLDDARDELWLALSATAATLGQLGDPALGAGERRGVLQELPLHQVRQHRVLGALDELFGG